MKKILSIGLTAMMLCLPFSVHAEEPEANNEIGIMGTYTETGYSNAVLGYEITAQEGVSFSDVDSICKINGFNTDLNIEDQAFIAMYKNRTVPVLSMEWPDSNKSISINMNYMGDEVTADQIYEELEANVEYVKSDLESYGYENISVEIQDYQFDGATIKTVHSSYTDEGETYVLRQIPVLKSGLLFMISVGGGQDSDIEEAMSCIKSLPEESENITESEASDIPVTETEGSDQQQIETETSVWTPGQ